MTDRFIRKFGPGGGLMIPIQSFESNNLNASVLLSLLLSLCSCLLSFIGPCSCPAVLCQGWCGNRYLSRQHLILPPFETGGLYIYHGKGEYTY